jgi:hypothetical protein
MIIAGFFGGVINYCRSFTKETGSKRKFWTCIFLGVGASFLVPLFLGMISSDLITNSRLDDKYFLVFAGLCLVAAIFSGRFIDSIGERILKKVEEQEKKVDAIEEKNETQQEIIEQFSKQVIEPRLENLETINGEVEIKENGNSNE